MIRIYGDWAADVYERGYIVGKVGTTFDRKTGRDREIIPHPCYFHELSDAIEYAYKAMVRDEISKKRKDLRLEDVIDIMRDIERRMEANVAGWNVLIDESVEALRRQIK